MCNYTHLVNTITHLRCVRLHTFGCVKLHTFVLHTLYLLKVCYFTHLLRKNTPLLITHLSTLHTFPTFTHLLDIHTFLNFTHLLNIHTFICYTPFEYTHLSQVRPNNSILHASIFIFWCPAVSACIWGSYINPSVSLKVYFLLYGVIHMISGLL